MKLRLALLGAFVLAAVAGESAVAREATVGTEIEAWYATLPQLGTRPEGTLHVGATAGVEDSRTYLTLDLSSIDDEVVGGTLTLPVDVSSSQSPETATIAVCLSGSPGGSVEGSADPPPTVDCTDDVRAKWVDGAFTADLALFSARLRTVGLAFVAVPDAAATWHVALWSRSSTSPDAVPITARLVLPDPAVAAAPTHEPMPTAPARPAFAAPEIAFADSADPVPLSPVFDPPSTAPPILGAAQLRAPPDTGRYADSFVFTLPLVLLVLAWGIGYALTRPIQLPDGSDVSRREGLLEPRRAPRRARVARARRANGSAAR